MSHISLSDTCAELIVSCPLTHLWAEFVPLMAPCWCFIARVVKHVSSFKEGSQRTKSFCKNHHFLWSSYNEKGRKKGFKSLQLMMGRCSQRRQPNLKHRSGTTAFSVCSNSNSISREQAVIRSDLWAQQYLLQNTQDWNNFLPAKRHITSECRQLHNSDPQVEDVSNLF